jgi:hypothetical protein
MFWNEVRQLWRGGFREYVTDKWNFMDSALIALYLAGLILQLVLYVSFSAEKNDIGGAGNCSNRNVEEKCGVLQCLAQLEMNWKTCNATEQFCRDDYNLLTAHSKYTP